MRSGATLLAAVGSILAVAGAASSTSAQTATPTPGETPTSTPTFVCTPATTPQACAGTKKLNVMWAAKDPLNAKVALSATRCPAPPLCEAAGDLVTVPPLSLILTDANAHTLQTVITGPGAGTQCPHGHDTYRTTTDRLRLVYGAATDGIATTIVAKVKLPQSQSTPPSLTGPITFTLRDSCGYGISGIVSTCVTRTTANTTYLKCF